MEVANRPGRPPIRLTTRTTSSVPSCAGGLSANRLDLGRFDMGARKPDGTARFRCPLARDREYEAGQPWNAANPRLARSADGVGVATTSSVVKSILFIIVVDAIFGACSH